MTTEWLAELFKTQKEGDMKTEIKKFQKLGFQVWVAGAPASGYFETAAEALTEAQVIDAEDRMGGRARHGYHNMRTLKASGDWKPTLRYRGIDADEGADDL